MKIEPFIFAVCLNGNSISLSPKNIYVIKNSSDFIASSLFSILISMQFSSSLYFHSFSFKPDLLVTYTLSNLYPGICIVSILISSLFTYALFAGIPDFTLVWIIAPVLSSDVYGIYFFMLELKLNSAFVFHTRFNIMFSEMLFSFPDLFTYIPISFTFIFLFKFFMSSLSLYLIGNIISFLSPADTLFKFIMFSSRLNFSLLSSDISKDNPSSASINILAFLRYPSFFTSRFIFIAKFSSSIDSSALYPNSSFSFTNLASY